MEPEIFFTALILLTKGCEVFAQRVEFLTQSCSPTLCATSYLQPAGGQCSVPAIIKPIITPIEPIPVAPTVPTFPQFGGCPPPMPMPPICLGGKDDDDWHHLLYFLIFALRNRGGCGNSCGGYGGNCGSGCGGGCGGGWGGGCGGYGCGGYGCGGYGCGGGNGCGNCAYDSYSNFFGNDISNFGGNSIKNNGNDVIYVPYPIAVPMNCATGSSFPCPSLLDSSPTLTPATSSCSCDCKDPNEINLTIRTDCQSK